MARVEIVDDTQVANSARMLAPIDARNMGLPLTIRFLPLKDKHGRQMQERVSVKRVFEGRHLELAVLRARRWIRSGGLRDGRRPPRHVILALAAFHRLDPAAFQTAAVEAASS